MSINCCKSASINVYICMPNANGTTASPGGDQDLPTHRMITESRPLLTASAPPSPHQCTSSTTATQRCGSKAKLRIIRRLYMHSKHKWGMSEELRLSGPSYTPYDGGESTSIAPPSPHEATPSTIATQPWRLNAKLRIICRICGMSKELEPLCLIRTPRRLLLH